MFVSVSCDSTQLGSITSQEKLFTLTLPVSRHRCTSPGAASRGLSITASSGGWRAGGRGNIYLLFVTCFMFHWRHVAVQKCFKLAVENWKMKQRLELRILVFKLSSTDSSQNILPEVWFDELQREGGRGGHHEAELEEGGVPLGGHVLLVPGHSRPLLGPHQVAHLGHVLVPAQ